MFFINVGESWPDGMRISALMLCTQRVQVAAQVRLPVVFEKCFKL